MQVPQPRMDTGSPPTPASGARRGEDETRHLIYLKTYKAGISPSRLADEMMLFCEDGGFAEYMVPGFEHGIGMMGDEWRIGLNDGPFPYWTNPDHVYKADEMLICAMQYACPDEGIGFRYENPILIAEGSCEPMSQYPLAIEEI